LQQIGSTRAGTLEAIVKRHINMNRRTDTSALSQKLPDGTDVTEFVDGVLAQLSGSPTVAQVDQAILDAYEKL
jgi:replicative superfamily II helicase